MDNNGNIDANEVVVSEYNVGPRNMSVLGIFQLCYIKPAIKKIMYKDIAGKCVVAGDCICSIPKVALFE